MIDMHWLIGSVWTKKVIVAEPFRSTGRYSGGEWFVKLHFEPSGFPPLVVGDFFLDYAWVQLGHPMMLTPDGKTFRPLPERPIDAEWLVGKWVDMRFEQKEASTQWRGQKTYTSPRYLKLNLDPRTE